MINSRRPNTDINGEDIEWFLHTARTVVERNPSIQLRSWHPKLLLRIDPHSIHPEKTLVVNKHRRCTVGRDPEDLLPVETANVYIAVGIDRCAAWKIRQYCLLKSEGVECCSKNSPVAGVGANGSGYCANTIAIEEL